jgi:hypothetical protein
VKLILVSPRSIFKRQERNREHALFLHLQSESLQRFLRLILGSSSKFRYRCRNRKRSELPITDTELSSLRQLQRLG